MRKELVSLAVVTLAANLITFGNEVAHAANVTCGDTIVADTKLDGNVSCLLFPDTDGITIGADSVTLNLNGFTITGDPSVAAVGVFIPGRDEVTIKNGTISGFQDGIRAFSEATDLDIKDVVFSGQRLSSIVIVNSADVKIKRVIISQPPGDGVNPAEGIRLANVTDAKVKNVTVDGGYFGLLAIGDPGVGESGVATEIDVTNSVFSNSTHGIFLVNTTDSNIVGNRISDVGGIGIGLVDGSVGNKIGTNNATGSDDVDMFHDETSTPNKWTNNTCGTRGGDDIDCP